MDPSPLFNPPPIDPTGFVAVDAPCLHCGYNLRGLTGDGNCPECGRSVESSLRGGLLRFASHDWLKRTANGIRVILLTIIATLMGCVCLTAWAVASFGGGPTSTAAPPSFATSASVVAVLALGFTIALALGVYLATTRDPSKHDSADGWTARRIARFSLAVFVGVSLVLDLTRMATFESSPWSATAATSWPPTLGLILGLIGSVLAGLSGVFFLPLALLRHFASLMQRVPRLGLVTFARVVFWSHFVAIIVLAIAYAVNISQGLRINRAIATANAAGAPPTTGWVAGPGRSYSHRASLSVMWTAFPAPPSTATASRFTTLGAIGYLSNGPMSTMPAFVVGGPGLASAPAFNPTWSAGASGTWTYTAPDGTKWMTTPQPPGSILFRSMVLGQMTAGLGACFELAVGIAGIVFLAMVQRALSDAAAQARLNTAPSI